MSTTQQHNADELEQAVDNLLKAFVTAELGLTESQQAALDEAQRRENANKQTNAQRTRQVIHDFSDEAGGPFASLFDEARNAEGFAKLYAMNSVDMMCYAANLHAASMTFEMLATHLLKRGAESAR
jgi:hypothetical protein